MVNHLSGGAPGLDHAGRAATVTADHEQAIAAFVDGLEDLDRKSVV